MSEPDFNQQNQRVQRFALNTLGRDFVVGDIHGMFPHREALLWRVEFDPNRDRLFSVGDLVDRGPASRSALGWLSRHWFHACRGNHEQFAIESDLPEERDYWVRYNGGGWWQGLSAQERADYRTAFLGLPLALQIETAGGVVGVVHADVPPLVAWEEFLLLLDGDHPEVTAYALFSRNRVQRLAVPEPVPGVVRVYCGHTPVREAHAVSNVHFIDTGAVYALEGYADARLTLVEIHPTPHREYAIRCEESPRDSVAGEDSREPVVLRQATGGR
jgi:serine/threonine protein phosphatase 1